MCHSFLIHLFTDGHLGCFQHLALVNCAAMNIGVHRFFWIGVSGSLGCTHSIGIARSKNNSMFSVLRKFYTVFHSGCASLPSHPQCTRVPFSEHPTEYWTTEQLSRVPSPTQISQHLLFVDLAMMVILTHVKWYLTAILICISLMVYSFWQEK